MLVATTSIYAQQDVVGKLYDSQANGYLTLYNRICPDSSIATYNNQRTLYWNATSQNGGVLNAQNGSQMQGCYLLSPASQQVIMLVVGAKEPMVIPYSAFGFNQNNANSNNNQPSNNSQPAYNWNSTPTTNLTGSFGGGQQTQLQGLPNQNKPSCVSRTINGVMQSCK